ncbi:MAG TPA: prepilin-type N-terminal cleavage/methylation domain-containing protein [Gemmatimonadaceae bacterium]
MRPPARRGMTLMELVVALVITGMMAAMGAATFSSIIDHRRIIRSSTGEMERASALRDQIRTWMLSGTVQIVTGGAGRGLGRAGTTISASNITMSFNNSAASSTNSGNGITAAVAGGDELTFVTTAPNPANAPSVRMRLFIDADESTPETGLTLEYQPSTSTPLKRIQLEPTIGVLKVEFLDQRTNQWFESNQGAAVTPIAVRLSMQPYDGGRIPGILQLPMVFPIGALLVGR